MLLPIGRFANSESRLVALFFGYVVGRQRAADGLVHHRQAVICAWSLHPMKKPPLG
jgi:hypothetical protein